jgi:hypothetical protein
MLRLRCPVQNYAWGRPAKGETGRTCAVGPLSQPDAHVSLFPLEAATLTASAAAHCSLAMCLLSHQRFTTVLFGLPSRVSVDAVPACRLLRSLRRQATRWMTTSLTLSCGAPRMRVQGHSRHRVIQLLCTCRYDSEPRRLPVLVQQGAQPRVACKGLASSTVSASLVCKCDVYADPGAAASGWARTRAARRACWRTRAPRLTRGWARTRPRSATPRGAASAATCPSYSRRVAGDGWPHACL